MAVRTWWQGLYFVGKHGQLRHGFWKAWTENLKISIIMMRSSKIVNWRVFQLIVPSWWPCWRSLHGCQLGSFLDGTRLAGCIITSRKSSWTKHTRPRRKTTITKQQAETHLKTLPDHPPLKPTMPFSNASFPAFGCTPQIQRYAKTKRCWAFRTQGRQASTYAKDMTKNHVSESRTCFWSFLAPQNNAKVRCFEKFRKKKHPDPRSFERGPPRI